MTEDVNAETPRQPDRLLPVLHALFAAAALALMYAPFLELGDGAALSLVDISGAWGLTTVVILGLLGIASLLLIAADRVSWERLLVVDMMIVIALIPAVIGVLVGWEAPETGVGSFAWGFWGAIVLLVARFPLSIWIRTHAARMQAHVRNQHDG